jgi:hypothetical protein
MDTILSNPLQGELSHICTWMPHSAPEQLHHIPHTCTHDAVPGGQAPGEITATSYRLLAQDDAADLAWWLEALPF